MKAAGKPVKEKKKKPSLQKRVFSALFGQGAQTVAAAGAGSSLSSLVNGFGERGHVNLGSSIVRGIPITVAPDKVLPIAQNMYDVRNLSHAADYGSKFIRYPLFDDRTKIPLQFGDVPVQVGADAMAADILESEAGMKWYHQSPAENHLMPDNRQIKHDIAYASVVQRPERQKNFEELAERAERFIKDQKLRESGVKINLTAPLRPTKPGYNAVTNTVSLSRNNSDLALHRLAKASDLRGSVAKEVLRKMPLLGATIAIPFAGRYADTVSKANPDRLDSKALNFIKDHPVATALGGYAGSVLYPEAKAAYIALKHIAKTEGKDAAKAALKRFWVPHLGKYMLGGIPIAAGLTLAKRIAERPRGHEKTSSSHPFQTADEVRRVLSHSESRKAFWSGFAGAALPVTATLSYLHGTAGGKAISEAEGEKVGPLTSKFPYLTALATGSGVGILAGKLARKSAVKGLL